MQIWYVGQQDLMKKDQRMDASGFICYLDESGGEFSSDPRLRRAGWGLAFLEKTRVDGDPEGGNLMANTPQNDVDLQHELWKACTLAIRGVWQSPWHTSDYSKGDPHCFHCGPAEDLWAVDSQASFCIPGQWLPQGEAPQA